MKISDSEYRKWLKSTYIYYYRDGEDTYMTDSEWDYVARRIDPEDHEELRGTKYVPGQSLFWLPAHKYPDWAKQ